VEIMTSSIIIDHEFLTPAFNPCASLNPGSSVSTRPFFLLRKTYFISAVNTFPAIIEKHSYTSSAVKYDISVFYNNSVSRFHILITHIGSYHVYAIPATEIQNYAHSSDGRYNRKRFAQPSHHHAIGKTFTLNITPTALQMVPDYIMNWPARTLFI